MEHIRNRFLRGVVFVVAAGLTGLVMPQLSGPQSANAQAAAPTGVPLAICGPIASYTPASSGAVGSITFSNVNTVQSFTLPAGTTFPGLTTIATGTNLCLVGTVNTSGQLLSVALTPNSSTTVNLCGPVTAYTPASLSSLGSLTIGGQVITLGLGTIFTGTTLAIGSNSCIAAAVNSLGVVNSGVVTANTTGATGSTLASICGPVSSYTAATSTTAGSITISNVSANATYTLPAGFTVSGNPALSSGSNICVVSVSTSSGQLSTATFITNAPTQVVTCGTVGRYTAATTNALGALTIGAVTVPLAIGTTFTGATLTTGASQCFTLTLNSLGQVVNGSISTPLAAVLYVPESAPTLRYHNLARPL